MSPHTSKDFKVNFKVNFKVGIRPLVHEEVNGAALSQPQDFAPKVSAHFLLLRCLSSG